ncbi:MAG: PAS domain S-box protein [Candidatus Kariarchaeaceae archaeon]
MKWKCLYVDDNEDLLEISKAFLEKINEKLEIITANSVGEALEIMESQKLDGIISDYQMYPTNGLEFLKMIREKGNTIPFIIFTGRGREEVAIEALNLGADRYLQKGGEVKAQFGVLAQAVCQEITHWKIQDELKKSEDRHHSMFKLATDSIFIIDPEDGRIIDANEIAHIERGYTREELLKMKIFDLWPSSFLEEAKIGFSEVVSGQDISIELAHTKKDGTTYPVGIAAQLMPYGEKKVIMSHVRNITLRKQMEQEIILKKELAEKYFDTSATIMIIQNADQTIARINEKGKKLLGYEGQDLVGENWFDLFIPERNKKEVKKVFNSIISGENNLIEQHHNPVITRSGEEKIISWFNSCIKDKSGRIIQILSSGNDITDLLHSREKLAKQAEVLNAKVKESNCLYDCLVILQTNEYTIEQTFQEITNRIPSSFYCPDSIIVRVKFNDQVFTSSEFEETEFTKIFSANLVSYSKKKGEIDVFHRMGGEACNHKLTNEGNNLKITNEEKYLITSIVLQLDSYLERLETAQVLEENLYKYETLFNNANDAIFLYYMDGEPKTIIEVNDVACQRLGYSREEFLKMTPYDGRMVKLPPNNLDIIFEELSSKGKSVFESVHMSKTGQIIPVMVSAKVFKLNDRMVNLSIVRDITDIKKVEEDRNLIHEVLRHDIINKNTSIRGYLTLLEQSELTETQHNLLSKAMRVASETEKLIFKVRHLVKTENDEINSINVHSVIDKVLSSNRAIIEEKEIEIVYSTSPLNVYAGALFTEIIANLIENAVIHSNCKQIHINVKEVEEMVKITIEDDGQGISNEIKESLMAKGVKGAKSKGSGLGLYLVQKLVRRYKGRMEGLDSSLGGARFDIYLKKAE